MVGGLTVYLLPGVNWCRTSGLSSLLVVGAGSSSC